MSNFEIRSDPVDVDFFAAERERKGRKPGSRNMTGEANKAAAKAGAVLVRNSNITLREAARTIKSNTRLFIGDTRLARLISAELTEA